MSDSLSTVLFVNNTAHHVLRRKMQTTGDRDSRRPPRKCAFLALSEKPAECAASRAVRTRRAFLLSSALVLAQLPAGAPRAAQADSSPYAPSTQTDKPLPARLYEEDVQRVVKTASGLRYFDITVGSGEEARVGTKASCNYTSRLSGLYGTKLDSTFDHPSATPFLFTVGEPGMVPGFDEAVIGMKVGGKRRALLTPDIAYPNPDAKPAVTEFFARRRLLSVLNTNRDASIVFDIELLKVK